MSQYYVFPTLRDTEEEPKYTFAEVKWGKIVAIHHHWVPLDEFYKYFEANAFFVDITNVLVDGREPDIGDAVTNDPDEGYKIIPMNKTYTYEERKQYRIDVLKLTRDRKELEPILYNEVLFDADTVSQTRMEKARTFLEDNNIPSITWTTAENTRVDVTVEDFKAINTLIAIRSNELHVRYNRLKYFILSLEDGDELIDTIDWDYDVIDDNPDNNSDDTGGGNNDGSTIDETSSN